MPSSSAWNQVSLSRPGTASIFTPKAGIVQAWITSAPVTCMCTTASTGTTTAVSVASR